MTAKEQLKSNVDQIETEIEDILLKIKVTGLFQEKAEKLKNQYEQIRNKYYEQRLVTFTEEGNLTTELMVTATAKYAVDIENDILPQLRELHKIASVKQIALSIKESDQINLDEIDRILETFNNIDVKSSKYVDEITELKDYLKEFFYEMIKKDAEKNNRFEIINLLYEYKEKGSDFVNGVTRLFLQEVSDIFKVKKTRETIELVKRATVDEFNKEDIIALLIATGKKLSEETKVEKKNTIGFEDAIKKYKVIPYTKRRQLDGNALVDLGRAMREFGLNPLPKTEKDILRLREYDATLLDYGRTSGKWNKIAKDYNPDLDGVDLSYTNAVIIPRYMGVKSLRGTNLEGVDLRGVDLTDVDIEGANLLKTGADIRYCKGTCLGVSPYEEERIFVSSEKITPMKFKELTKWSAFPGLTTEKNKPDTVVGFSNNYPWHNRILRKYDMSCVDLSFEYIKKAYKSIISSYDNKVGCGRYKNWHFTGLDFSYTNININPREFDDDLTLNLEGVDLRDKDFTGVERYFVHCNLKGTGANIDPKYNSTVSEYVVGSKSKTR
jgi:hypothetical protein